MGYAVKYGMYPHNAVLQILCETGMTMVRYRKIVWENMQQSVLGVLERVDVTEGAVLHSVGVMRVD